MQEILQNVVLILANIYEDLPSIFI